MAEKRMFSRQITESDVFLEMPQRTQNLYFHLAMNADDDGFVNTPNGIMRLVGGKPSDLKILINKQYLLPFESGVIVIRHWRLHNYIRSDRYKPTIHQEEKSLLNTDNDGVYTFGSNNASGMTSGIPVGIPTVDKLDTQYRLDKSRLDKSSIEKKNIGARAYESYEENIGLISPIIAEAINGYLEDGVEDEMICLAIEEAAKENKRSWNYINAILINKVQRGIKTASAYKSDQEEWKRRKRDKSKTADDSKWCTGDEPSTDDIIASL